VPDGSGGMADGGVITAEFRADDLPVTERFGYWHDLTAGALIPTVIKSGQADDFRATLRALDLPAAFSRAFRAAYGLSPRDHRRHRHAGDDANPRTGAGKRHAWERGE
jgi:hypothetical protein